MGNVAAFILIRETSHVIRGSKMEEETAMDVWKNTMQQDINDLKNNQGRFSNEQRSMKDDIQKLQMSDQIQNQEINTLKESLSEIKEDTNWIRRKITGALITAVISAVVMGVIGVAIANIF